MLAWIQAWPMHRGKDWLCLIHRSERETDRRTVVSESPQGHPRHLWSIRMEAHPSSAERSLILYGCSRFRIHHGSPVLVSLHQTTCPNSETRQSPNEGRYPPIELWRRKHCCNRGRRDN